MSRVGIAHHPLPLRWAVPTLRLEDALSNPPSPPFEKGEVRGIFIVLCEPPAHPKIYLHYPLK